MRIYKAYYDKDSVKLSETFSAKNLPEAFEIVVSSANKLNMKLITLDEIVRQDEFLRALLR